MKYLAIDYGQKRTGIAVSDTGGSMAFPRKTILMRTRAAFFEELLALIEAEATDAIVIGANVFNLVLVSGVSVTLAPFTIPQNSTIAGMNASLVMDIPVMFAVMLLLTVPALLKGKLSRPQGIALLCIYAAFCVVQFTI